MITHRDLGDENLPRKNPAVNGEDQQEPIDPFSPSIMVCGLETREKPHTQTADAVSPKE